MTKSDQAARVTVDLDQSLPDYFHFVEGDPLRHRDDLGDRAVRWYEQGDFVVFPRLDIPCDLEFLQSVRPIVDTGNRLKKATVRAIAGEVKSSTYGKHVLSALFPGRLGDAVKFQKQVAVVTEFLNDFVDYTFPGHRVVNSSQCTWRFAATGQEPMHFDGYNGFDNDDWSVRLFVNLDTAPRLWATSYRVHDVQAAYPGLVGKLPAVHPNARNTLLSAALPWHEAPVHVARFGPLSAWLVHSQSVAHQVLFGRKMLAYTYFVDPASMLDPSLNFADRVRKGVSRV